MDKIYKILSFNIVVVVIFVFSSLVEIPHVKAQQCEASQTQSQLQMLRRMSLDLRGYVPSVQEYEDVIKEGKISDILIDTMLHSEDFVHQIRQYHKNLLWINVGDQRIGANRWQLAPPNKNKGEGAYWIRGRSKTYRNANNISCLNQKQVGPLPILSGTEVIQEGWVEIQPYWAPGTTIKICAFDAQDALEGRKFRKGEFSDKIVECVDDSASPECGCGENLKWCQARLGQTERTDLVKNRTDTVIAESMSEQMLRFIDDIIRLDRDYSHILLERDVEINGPINHWLKEQTHTGGDALFAHKFQDLPVVALGYDKASTWQRVTRGPSHSGILTMPAFLLKFATNRARANRFYNAFLCAPFQPPPSGLPAMSDACNSEPNLAERCVCEGCHATLEPAAAHWGGWLEAGVGPMPKSIFPVYDEKCTKNNAKNNLICRFFYLTPDEVLHPKLEPYVGKLYSHVFANDERNTNLDSGPRGIAEKALEDGRFARCAVENIWSWLLKRKLFEGEKVLVDALAADFSLGGFQMRSLVKKLLRRPEYREVLWGDSLNDSTLLEGKNRENKGGRDE